MRVIGKRIARIPGATGLPRSSIYVFRKFSSERCIVTNHERRTTKKLADVISCNRTDLIVRRNRAFYTRRCMKLRLSQDEFFRLISDMFTTDTISNHHCFLCATSLTAANRTKEHIFPRWMINSYRLSDKHLTILNGTRILYRNLTIPCCNGCNNGPLAELEKGVSDAINRGYSAVVDYDRLKIFQWCSKIVYGILLRELDLKIDIRKPDSPSIVSLDLFEQLTTMRFFMSSIINPINFSGFSPFSLGVLKATVLPEKDLNFNFQNMICYRLRGGSPVISPAMSLRCDDVYIVCTFNDGGSFQSLLDGIVQISPVPANLDILDYATSMVFSYKGEMEYGPTYNTDYDVINRTMVTSIDTQPVFRTSVLSEENKKLWLNFSAYLFRSSKKSSRGIVKAIAFDDRLPVQRHLPLLRV